MVLTLLNAGVNYQVSQFFIVSKGTSFLYLCESQNELIELFPHYSVNYFVYNRESSLSQSQMAYFFLVIFVLLSATSGSHIHESDEQRGRSGTVRLLCWYIVSFNLTHIL